MVERIVPASSDSAEPDKIAFERSQSPRNSHGFEAELRALREQRHALEAMGLSNPFFLAQESMAGPTTRIGGREYLNFANYNYIGLNGDPAVSVAAQQAIERHGTSVAASRIVSGERPLQRELELALAEFLDAEDCLALVSGYLTNVTVIGHLLKPGDAIFHDRLAHNSAIQGALLSRAKRIAFPHNDWRALDRLLEEQRGNYRRAMIFVEGVYSMDGDIAELPRFVELRCRHNAILMVDEAHSVGVLGRHGGGAREHFGLSGSDVDLWMGTLSKALASCGGYVAGNGAILEYLRYTLPGFIYSVGISPPAAAAAITALRRMQEEPQRVALLKARAQLFLDCARARGLDTGSSGGTAIVPILVGDPLRSIALANALFARGINVQPVLPPAVGEATARLRFFITSAHSEEQIRQTVDAVAEELARLRA